ncbi:MAG: DUF4124 domain-containing protein [Burkholderiaceae bacterium]|nr:DUF4124 domain-containing protein [Burkholderiaceae bacterium]
MANTLAVQIDAKPKHLDLALSQVGLYCHPKHSKPAMRAIHAITAFALFAADLTASAFAQQSAPAIPAATASAPKPPPPPPMINRWVDAHGRVHYGDALPPDAPEKTTQVGPVETSTPDQKAQADAQLQQYRSYLKPPDAPPNATPQPAQARATPQDNSCAGQWARYNAAVACAGQYHVAGGGLKSGFAANCPNLPQPQCPSPEQ